NRRHPSPDLRVPELLAAVTGRGAAESQSKQALKIRPGPSARGVLFLIRGRGGRRSQFRTLPPPGPGPRPRAAARGQFLFDCVLRAAHGAAAG
ncbi:hypothetical protein MC885_010122, partial [Smutsia gigantea]